LVRRVSPEPRLDVYARERRPGFDHYGNEPNKFANGLDGYHTKQNRRLSTQPHTAGPGLCLLE
jgi:hypothetical protein